MRIWLAACVLTLASAPADVTRLRQGKLYGVTVSAADLAHRKAREVSIGDALGVLASKRIHDFDPDFYFVLRARADGPVKVEGAAGLEVSVREIHEENVSEQRRSHTDAQPITLNRVVLASADERPYIGEGYSDLLKGQHWYRFTAEKDQLAFFQVEALDRDVPADVEVFTLENGALTPYVDGTHGYTPEATQNFPGLSNYRTRRIRAGQTYFLRVSANHPSYRLRTSTYPLPPYRDPRQAVRTAMDFAVSLGDSWLNNIPRRGSVATRDTLPHPETQNCIACHPVQFTTRAYLTAVRNGYEPVNLDACRNLLEQIQNNPRPLAGHESVNWTRMIFSARTVSSRIPVLLDAASALPGFGGPPRDIVQGAVGFLKLHYKGLERLAEEEADGASPAVSPLEIALQSWQTFGLAGEDRAFLEQQIAAYEPNHTIDRNWKIVALAAIDRKRYQAEITKLIGELRFDEADFITYHSLYAMAMAGLKPGDPRVDRLVERTLRNQLPSGGWQGAPGSKAFHTPFRETQFAIMALSTLYPGSWTKPADATSALAFEDLGHASKVVRIRAAENIRRHLADPAPLAAALRSPDRRTRSGALHVFGKQFRRLTQYPLLLAAVLPLLDDAAPLIRLQAAMALGRWQSWAPDETRILDALAERLDKEQDARVRRVLQEAISAGLDENIGYAEAWMRAMSRAEDRTRTVGALHARSKAQGAVLAKHLRKGGRAARLGILTALWDLPLRHMAIPEQNRERAEVVLPAYYAEYSNGVRGLHEPGFDYAPYREALGFTYGARNGFHKARVGNDSELIDLSGAGPELEAALIALIDGPDRELKLAAIKAGAVLGSSMTRQFTMAAFRVLRGEDAEARAAVRYVFENHARGRLTLGDHDHYDAPFVEALAAALDPAKPDALAVALPLVAELTPGSVLSRTRELMARVDALLFSSPLHPRTLGIASSFPRVADGPLMRSRMLDSLTSADRAVRVSAAETAVKAYLADPTMPELAGQFAAASKGEVRRMMLDLLDPSRFSLRLSALSLYNPPPAVQIPADANLFSSNQVRDFVASSLLDGDADVRAAALDLARRYPALRKAPQVERALAKMPPVDASLDFGFFVEKVQPILARPGADGKACVVCHATHGIFPLRIPVKGRFSERQSRENFEFAARVIDRGNPQKSLLLVKPTRPNDSAGDPNLYLATHNGGERWQGNESSEEYQTILRWIRGAKAQQP